jgi:hypothetical protein
VNYCPYCKTWEYYVVSGQDHGMNSDCTKERITTKLHPFAEGFNLIAAINGRLTEVF